MPAKGSPGAPVPERHPGTSGTRTFRKLVPERHPGIIPPTNNQGDVIIENLFKPPQNDDSESERLQEFKAAVTAVYNKDSLTMKSVLNREQVIALTRGLIFAKKYKSLVMLDLVNNVLELSVSVIGKTTGSGRMDLREILKSLLHGRDVIEAEDNLRNKLLSQ